MSYFGKRWDGATGWTGFWRNCRDYCRGTLEGYWRPFWTMVSGFLLMVAIPYTGSRVIRVREAGVDAALPWPLAKAASATGWGEIALVGVVAFLSIFVPLAIGFAAMNFWAVRRWWEIPGEKLSVVVESLAFAVLASAPLALAGSLIFCSHFVALKFASTPGGRYELEKGDEERREEPPPPLGGGVAWRVENEIVVSLAK